MATTRNQLIATFERTELALNNAYKAHSAAKDALVQSLSGSLDGAGTITIPYGRPGKAKAKGSGPKPHKCYAPRCNGIGRNLTGGFCEKHRTLSKALKAKLKERALKK